MRALILGLLLTLLPAQAAQAEDRCTDAQKKAQGLYDQGRLEEIPGELAPCFGSRIQREDQVAAYALLAQVFLVLDDVERARTQVRNLLFFDPLYKPGPEAPPRFANLLEEVRTSLAASQTASVSKTSESLWDAPASVVVVTAEEIERRGYLDLEAVLHDLPGFDISRSNGNLYSSFYARGFRSDLNDRILFLVDGVEQNDLSSNAADLSRQYPLSNVDRIEVVYGPASTMYGANAYIGVIHVITREPEAYLGEGRRYGAELLAAGGSFETAVGELTLAGRLREEGAVWALTGRRFSSAEMDLSRFDDWDYRFDTVDYASRLRIPGERANPRGFPCGQDTAYYRVRCDEKGTILAVEPTELAIQIARAADERLVRDNALSFSDQTEDWSVQGKVRLDNLTAGFQAWSREEGGLPWRTETTRAGAGDGNRITPQQVSLYLRYGQWFASNSRLQAFARYRQDRVDREASSKVLLRTFASGERTLPELLARCTRSSEPDCFSENLDRVALDRLSTELASEVTWMYRPQAKIETVSGFELRKSSVQLDSVYADEGNRFLIAVEPSGHTGAGLYSQITWAPGSRGTQLEAPGGEAPAWSFVAGGRLDYTEISGRPARDPVFSPRLAVIHHPSRDWSLKVVYAEAFKEPTDFEKFSAVQGARRDNPDLEPERVRNLELIAGWRSGRPASAEMTVYQADYRDLVTLQAFDCVIRRCPLGTDSFTQFQNAGASQVQGAQLRVGWIGKTLEVLGNYTYTRSFEIDPLDAEGDPVLDSRGRPVERLRVGDIAGHRANLEVFLHLPRQLRLDLRSSFIGSRQTGAGTTVTTNPLTRFAPVTLAHATLTWRAPLPSLTARLTVNNLFDRRYSDPGVRTAGAGFAASLPQPGRTFFLGLAWQSSPNP